MGLTLFQIVNKKNENTVTKNQNHVFIATHRYN